MISNHGYNYKENNTMLFKKSSTELTQTTTIISDKKEKEKIAIEHYINVVYNGVLTCPHCHSTEKVYRRNDRPRLCQCNNCNYSFSLFKGTIFEKSSTSLLTWFEAQKLLLNDKTGMPALQLQRHLKIFKDQNKKSDVSYKCAWRIFNKIRAAMGNENIIKMSNSVIEPDETYIGPKPRKTIDKKNKKGRGTNKTPICGFYDRYLDVVRAKVMYPNQFGQKLTGKQIKEFIDQYNANNTTLITDEFVSYDIFNNCPENEYTRLSINHSNGQYSNGKGVHTNHIEGFWSTMKRGGLHRRYHRIDEKYNQNYINEYCFRFNHRKQNHNDAFDSLLKQTLINKEKSSLVKKQIIQNFSFIIQYDKCLYVQHICDFSKTVSKSIYCNEYGINIFVLERFSDDAYYIWEFLDDFNVNEAFEFLTQYDYEKNAA